MSTQVLPLFEINTIAREVIIQKLGIINAMRFYNQFAVGVGNYTNERHALFEDETVDSLVSEITRKKLKNKAH